MLIYTIFLLVMFLIWLFNFFDKRKYALHYENLQLYLRLGLKLKRTHRVLEFYQSQWLKTDFEKWRAIHASVSEVLAWVACWCGWHASVGGVGGMLTWVEWVEWVACLHGWYDSVGGVDTCLHRWRAIVRSVGNMLALMAG